MGNKNIEYIDRERLKEAISADCQHLFSFDESFYDIVMNDIDEITASDVAPIVHGKWEFKAFYKGTSRGAFECQNCKGAFEGSIGFNYCQNCGSKMDL